MSLGNRIKKARERKGLTQVELGKILNVSDATINRYEKEHRRPDPTMLGKLADVLDVSLDYLLDRENKSVQKDKTTTEAAHRSDNPMDDLPLEAQKSLQDFKDYLFRKYGKK